MCLFAAIGVVAFIKKSPSDPASLRVSAKPVPAPVVPHTPPASAAALAKAAAPTSTAAASKTETQAPASTPVSSQGDKTDSGDDFPQVDRINQLFNTKGVKLPIVDTVTYNSRVEWLKGRPAWIADYAVHFSTSRHFIARSLNGKPDYFSQKVSTGNKFNVFRTDKDIQFYLLIDISRCKLGLYYFDKGTNERVLLKTYAVGLGRKDTNSPSGCATPLGLYSLGSKIAVYQPGTMGAFGNKKVEMVQLFGTRWIPFDQEIEKCTSPSKGLGLHGIPLQPQSDGSGFIENRAFLNTYDGNGNIRLASEDIEEIFSIVITKPSFILLVKDFHEARLPGIEVDLPTANKVM